MASDPIKARCRRDYFPAAHNSGSRVVDSVRLIVIHDEEAPTARSAAEWFQNPNSRGSAHLCVDNDRCYRCLRDTDIPWGAANANIQGFHIEQAGYASWSRFVWRVKNLRMLQRSAYKAAQSCRRFNIPPRWVDADGLMDGKSGITSHAAVSAWSKAAGLPGDHSHTDPGPNFPRWLYMQMVKGYYKSLA